MDDGYAGRAKRFLWTVCAALIFALAVSRSAPAEETFSIPVTGRVVATDPATGEPRAYDRALVGEVWREVLGTTGRVPLARRYVQVGRGGRVFLVARVPEEYADEDQQLHVYFREAGVWRLRGSLDYEPGGRRTLSNTLVLPEIPEGPVLTEVHLRGASDRRWQEISSEPVKLPGTARVRLGFALDGIDPTRLAPVEIVVAARSVPSGEDEDEEDEDESTESVELMRRLVRPASGQPVWQETTIDLAELGEGTFRFQFRSRAGEGVEGPSPGVVWGAPTLVFDEIRQAFPAVVVISFDSLRPDVLGVYGGEEDTSPSLDEYFSTRGAVLTGVATQSVTTQPAHMTMLTALNPCIHGVLSHGATLGAGIPTLAEQFQGSGYATAAFTDGGALASEFGFDRGFDEYDEGGQWDGPPVPAELAAFDRAISWLRDHQGSPVFVFIHSYHTRPFRYTLGGGEAGLGRYRDQVRDADNVFRRFIEELDRFTLDEETIVVVTSGHGEELFEHGAAGHGTQLFEESLRVPLLMRGPGVLPGRYDVSMGLVDFAPTILDLTGREALHGVQGRSLAGLFREEKLIQMPQRFSEARRDRRLRGDGTLERWPPPAFAVRKGAHKVVMHSGAGPLPVFEAYDLGADPEEGIDVLSSLDAPPPDWALRLKAAVQNYPAVCERLAKAPGPAAMLSEDDRAKLRALGYAN